jgi:hypothetical protein
MPVDDDDADDDDPDDDSSPLLVVPPSSLLPLSDSGSEPRTCFSLLMLDDPAIDLFFFGPTVPTPDAVFADRMRPAEAFIGTADGGRRLLSRGAFCCGVVPLGTTVCGERLGGSWSRLRLVVSPFSDNEDEDEALDTTALFVPLFCSSAATSFLSSDSVITCKLLCR